MAPIDEAGRGQHGVAEGDLEGPRRALSLSVSA